MKRFRGRCRSAYPDSPCFGLYSTLLLLLMLVAAAAWADETPRVVLGPDDFTPSDAFVSPAEEYLVPLDREPLQVRPRAFKSVDSVLLPSTGILSEGFEGTWPTANWFVGKLQTEDANATWGKTAYRKASGSYSAWAAQIGGDAPGAGNDVPNNMGAWMQVGPFNLSGFNSGEIDFDLWLENESCCDSLGVLASTDGNNFVGWTYSTTITVFADATLPFADWPQLGNLAQYPQVWFAFLYQTDASVTFEGAYVDNIAITAESASSGLNLFFNQVEATNCPSMEAVVSVIDDQGTPITGLTAGNFTLKQDGVTQTITVDTASGAGSDIAVALVIDHSTSLSATDLANAKQASIQLINLLGPNDQVAVWSFGTDVTLLQDYTTSKAAAIAAVNSIVEAGSTALYDAIYDSALHSQTVAGRKGLVVMTDGEDTASNHTLNEAIAQAQASGVPVFTIGFGSADATVLGNIAAQTGGIFYQGAGSADLANILNSIGQTLSNQYIVRWTTTVTDGASHSVEITVQRGNDSDLETRTYNQAGTACDASGVSAFINQINASNCPSIETVISVLDGNGAPVPGLTKDNFALKQDGVSQTFTVDTAAGAGSDIAVALVIDHSTSLSATDLDNAKQASIQLINLLGANDQVAVWSFGTSVTLLQDYTTNKAAAIAAVNSIVEAGSTALYDAIYDSALHSQSIAGRKGLVVMTDGEDTASSHTQGEAIAQAQASGVPVFTIGFGSADATVLSNIAAQTGGIFYQGAGSADLANILNSIGQTLSNQYLLNYTTSVIDGLTHDVDVTVNLGNKSDTVTRTYDQGNTLCGSGLQPSRLFNISTRAGVETGDNVMIAGFIIDGSGSKKVLIRARGPSLASAGVSDVLADPALAVYAGQILVASNDNWPQSPDSSSIDSLGGAPPSVLESAILTTLTPGAYTAIVNGIGGTTGTGIVEVFDVDVLGISGARVYNISTRAKVETGDKVMIAGFIIDGNGSRTVLIRARGPSLSGSGVSGVLSDPMLELYSGQTLTQTNDDWQQATNSGTLNSSGGAPPDPRESAILITLPPGEYTAIVRGFGGTTGVAIVEVFLGDLVP